MKPLEVWTCQRAENLKKSSKISKNNYAAKMVSAARRQIIGGGGGGAPIKKKRRGRGPPNVGGGGAGRRGRRTALRWQSMPRKLNLRQGLQTCIWIKRDSSASGSASLN